MKFNFRKIASVLLSAVTLGSTVGMAANYPAPFVVAGSADAAIVYGASAPAGLDLAAATSIANDLAKGVTVTTVSGGESTKIEKGTNLLSFGETLTDIRASLTNDQLPTLLKDETYKNSEKEEFDYTQTLELGALKWTFVEDDDDNNIVGFHLENGDSIMNYSLEFDTAVDAGKNSAGELEYLKDTTIKFMGKEYYILKADNSTKFELLDAANTVGISVGEEKTVTIGGKTYTVSLDFLSSDKAKVKVNGEVTDALEEGETDKLADGSYVGVKEILYEDVAGTRKAVITIGSGKLVLEDGETVELNGEDVDGLTAYIDYDNSADELNGITIEWKQEDETWLNAGDTLAMPGFEAVKVIVQKMTFPKKEEVKVTYSGTDKIVLKAPIKDGDAEIVLLDGNETTFKWIGEKNKKLVTGTGKSIVINTTNNDRYFVASWVSSGGDDSESYLLEVTKIEEEDGKNWTTIKNVVKSGQEWTKKEGDTIEIGEVELTINDAYEVPGTGKGVVNLSISDGNFKHLYTAEGLKIYLPVDSADEGDGLINLTAKGGVTSWAKFKMVEEDKDETVGSGEWINITLDHSSKGAQVGSVVSNWAGDDLLENDEDEDVNEGYVESALATFVQHDTGGDQDTLDIVYHGEESYANVFVAAPAVGVGIGAVPVVKDSEVASVSSKNLVVVGGSCVNSVAAQVLGVSAGTCGEAFTAATGVGAGQFLVKVVTSPLASGKIAMLVAGYEADDTAKAATYVTAEKPATDVGTSITKASTEVVVSA